MKKKFTIELESRYTRIRDVIPEVVAYFTKLGYECNVKDLESHIIFEINNIEYRAKFSQRILGPLPPQIVILEKSS